MKNNQNLRQLARATFILLSTILYFTSGFTINKQAYSIINSEFHQRLNYSSELENKWQMKAAIPSYLQDTLKLFNNSTNADSFLERLLDGVSSDDCKVHVAEWFMRISLTNLPEIVTEKNKWVPQMVDSWGKLPEGILSGHVDAYGDFDECVQIKVRDLEILNGQYTDIEAEKSFEGQYCTSYILDYGSAMSLTPKPPGTLDTKKIERKYYGIQESVSIEELLKRMLRIIPTPMPLIPSVATCFPNTCSAEDVQQILVNGLYMTYIVIPDVNPEMLLWPVTISCTEGKKPSLGASEISVIVLLTILVTLALVAGIIDYWNSNNGSEKETPSTPLKRSTGYNYLMAFSLYTNVKKLVSTRRSPDDLGCLHGIRFFSTAWVVLAHTYVMLFQTPLWNKIDVNHIYEDWTSLAVINGTVAVDTFFVMSGMLATYNILKMLDWNKGKINIPMLYVHRYIRLTPLYAMLVAIGATLYKYAGNGPNWYIYEVSEQQCRKNWWTNLLYINNLVHSGEICNGESWYLANDMQFFILTPFIVYPIWKSKNIGGSLLTIYTILSCIAPVLIVRFGNDVHPASAVTNGGGGAGRREIYSRPWSRISTYLVGVWLGWILHITRGKRVNIPKIFVLGLWLTSTGTALAVIFGIFPWFDPANGPIPEVSGYFYAGLGRFAWGVAIALVIFACIKGYGGIVNKFLSWKAFMPLGRLCFSVYLTAYQLQGVFHARLTVPIKWDKYTVINLYFAHLVMSYIAGFFCTLLFESPFITLQKLIFERKPSGGGKTEKSEKERQSKVESKMNKNNNNGDIADVENSVDKSNIEKSD